MPRPRAKYPKSTLIALRISEDMALQLRHVQERDGVPISEQVRRAIREWLEHRLVGRKRTTRSRERAKRS